MCVDSTILAHHRKGNLHCALKMLVSYVNIWGFFRAQWRVILRSNTVSPIKYNTK